MVRYSSSEMRPGGKGGGRFGPKKSARMPNPIREMAGFGWYKVIDGDV